MVKLTLGDIVVETERDIQPFNPAAVNNGWNDVEDILPPEKHEVMYFATADEGRNREIMIGHREGKNWTHCCLFYSTQTLNDSVKVTHWMELPDYPKTVLHP